MFVPFRRPEEQVYFAYLRVVLEGRGCAEDSGRAGLNALGAGVIQRYWLKHMPAFILEGVLKLQLIILRFEFLWLEIFRQPAHRKRPLIDMPYLLVRTLLFPSSLILRRHHAFKDACHLCFRILGNA